MNVRICIGSLFLELGAGKFLEIVAVNMVSKLIPRGWYGDKPDEVIVSDNDENIKKLKMIDERILLNFYLNPFGKGKLHH